MLNPFIPVVVMSFTMTVTTMVCSLTLITKDRSWRKLRLVSIILTIVTALAVNLMKCVDAIMTRGRYDKNVLNEVLSSCCAAVISVMTLVWLRDDMDPTTTTFTTVVLMLDVIVLIMMLIVIGCTLLPRCHRGVYWCYAAYQNYKKYHADSADDIAAYETESAISLVYVNNSKMQEYNDRNNVNMLVAHWNTSVFRESKRQLVNSILRAFECMVVSTKASIASSLLSKWHCINAVNSAMQQFRIASRFLKMSMIAYENYVGYDQVIRENLRSVVSADTHDRVRLGQSHAVALRDLVNASRFVRMLELELVIILREQELAKRDAEEHAPIPEQLQRFFQRFPREQV